MCDVLDGPRFCFSCWHFYNSFYFYFIFSYIVKWNRRTNERTKERVWHRLMGDTQYGIIYPNGIYASAPDTIRHLSAQYFSIRENHVMCVCICTSLARDKTNFTILYSITFCSLSNHSIWSIFCSVVDHLKNAFVHKQSVWLAGQEHKDLYHSRLMFSLLGMAFFCRTVAMPAFAHVQDRTPFIFFVF